MSRENLVDISNSLLSAYDFISSYASNDESTTNAIKSILDSRKKVLSEIDKIDQKRVQRKVNEIVKKHFAVA